ncbi:unnamed protein product [Agarophyton chilense]|eukprot:gb/GEZJ01005610.1/.p1 GENE.gb/GEZJ01005610.1/~~gb/GEZJ01005610.1/.p1  ORF type:complete len:426 (+),score=42.47 gb/GEZJ01005610.1/:112-1278(+)
MVRAPRIFDIGRLPSFRRVYSKPQPLLLKWRVPPVALGVLLSALHFFRRRRATLMGIFLLVWIFVDMDAYPLWWLSWLVHGAPTAERALSHNCSKHAQHHALQPLVVVVPLIASQLLRVEDSLRRWTVPSLYPCDIHAPTATRAHLSFFFDRSRNDAATARAAQRLQVVLSHPPLAHVLEACFSHVSLQFANMSASASRNSHAMDMVHNLVITGGSNQQFEAAMQLYQRTYQHMFLMEPDVYAIRSGWVQRALQEAEYGSFWQRGAIMRYSPRFNIGFAPFRNRYQRHINGNGLYRLGDRCFERYRQLVRKRYGHAAYDVAMCQFRLSVENLAIYQATAHRFEVSAMMVSVGVTTVKEDDLRDQFPEALLVHGKAKYVAFPALNVMQY